MAKTTSGEGRTDLVYLDYNCFQRSFDDHRQVRIRMEAIACEAVFLKAEQEHLRLVWSFMHEDESAMCPLPERRLAVDQFSRLCAVRVGPSDNIRSACLWLCSTRSIMFEERNRNGSNERDG